MILDHVAYAEDVLIGFIAALYESELDLPAEGKVEEVAASFIRGLPETSDDDARAAHGAQPRDGQADNPGPDDQDVGLKVGGASCE